MVEASAGEGPVRPVGPVDVRAVCGLPRRVMYGRCAGLPRRRLAARV